MMLFKLMITLLVLLSSSARAEGGMYQIELLVFAQTLPNTEVFEQTVSEIKWPSDLTELAIYTKPDELMLANSYAALSKDSQYRPIAHIAWLQPVVDGGLNAPVHIQDAEGRLNGYVQMKQGQGLQMIVDLELAADSADGTRAVYRLNEKRPVKLDEVYYLDHPKFGLVVSSRVKG